MKEIFKFNNGDKVRDNITGFTGIITARLDYMFGCVRYQVSPNKLTSDGGMIDFHYFDEPQLELIELFVIPDVERKQTGGERENPPKYKVPSR